MKIIGEVKKMNLRKEIRKTISEQIDNEALRDKLFEAIKEITPDFLNKLEKKYGFSNTGLKDLKIEVTNAIYFTLRDSLNI